MDIPPGLSCDQYYLYLASGYSYSPVHGIMYHTSQVPSEHWISKFITPYSFRSEEIAYWLQHRHYYDFNQKCWIQATFDKPRNIQDQIWRDATRSQSTFFRFQQKTDEIMQIMGSLNLTSKDPRSMPLALGETSSAGPSKAQLCRTTMRDRISRKRLGNNTKEELRRVLLKESMQKSRRQTAIREKIKTLPPHLTGDADFWNTVL